MQLHAEGLKLFIKERRCEKKHLPMLPQTSVLAAGRMTNVVSGKRLVCCHAEDVHLNTIDFLPVPAPTGANSTDLIDRGPLHCKLDKAEENSNTIPASFK